MRVWVKLGLFFFPLPHHRVREERWETREGDVQHSAAPVGDLRVFQSAAWQGHACPFKVLN